MQNDFFSKSFRINFVAGYSDIEMENEFSLKQKFTITSADSDMFGRVRLSALVNYLVQSAILSADSLGFGFTGLREQSLFWVLSRLTLEIDKPAQWKEIIEIETWPKRIEKILYIRDFLARNNHGEIIAKATSGWLAIDLLTKRPKNIGILDNQRLSAMSGKNAIEELPVKIMPRETDAFSEIATSYFDYDINGHVTASRYIDSMMDRFDLMFHKQYYPKKLVMNYLKETLPNEKLRLFESKINENEYYFEGNNLSAGLTAFRGIIVF